MSTHVISCKIDENAFRRFEEMRKKVNMSRSDFLRMIIQKAFENYENLRSTKVNSEDNEAEIAESSTFKPVPAIEVRGPELFTIKSPEVEEPEPKLEVEPERVEIYEPDFDEDLEDSEDSEIARYECGNCGYVFSDRFKYCPNCGERFGWSAVE
ncbi:zinc ribbon domain-containing protein [Geoglobus ahangari]|uniref:zinc ribbon domain-containing protein n=1 Tax=Geoglobus ahangari TaxID=113653 RepID=UPI00064FCC84|nr:zinc ribbon domain-containing protein [Geoglobus ahangari]